MDNKQKQQFTRETVKRYRMAATGVNNILAKVPAKERNQHEGQAVKVKAMLLNIADYINENIGQKPPRPTHVIQHDMESIQRVKNAREDLRALLDSMPEDKQGQIIDKYKTAGDLLVRFIDHLKNRIRIEDTWQEKQSKYLEA